MKAIKGVLFDLDNTLLDRTETFRRFTEELAGAYWGHIGAEEREELVKKVILLDEDGYRNKEELFSELTETMPWQKVPSLEELMAFYRREYVRKAVLMKDALSVLDGFRTRYKVGLVTNGRTDIQYGKLDQTGLRHRFDAILVSEEAGLRKPDPAIFLRAASLLRLTPEECVFVGDHPVNDIAGAAEAGMQTAWLRVNQPWRDEIRTAPGAVLTELKELCRLL
ncbi:HAD family hydrolase [Paenibacillus aurantius]|uniref:HAD family hydrolase n=1 Tax=Paenibacillus aurantius TaxID=2918900 RepID=A0AA96RIB6_9BACL|nr:HAD family hydrolase [Paenibacillus aurantius]WNQ12014.1 HAD family hydrolase [Paenibacillus aurantius]